VGKRIQWGDMSSEGDSTSGGSVDSLADGSTRESANDVRPCYDAFAALYAKNPASVQPLTDGKTNLTNFTEGLYAWADSRELNDFVYAGNSCTDAGMRFFRARYPRDPWPDYRPFCVCGHTIESNWYVEHVPTHTKYVVGKECVKRTIGNVLVRTCTFCATAHKNRKDNLCDECRKKVCFIKVSYGQKEEAKRMGARWFPPAKLWWCAPTNEAIIGKFGRMIP